MGIIRFDKDTAGAEGTYPSRNFSEARRVRDRCPPHRSII